MRLAWKIASRYLRSRKSHSAVNIISVVSVCGVSVATAALIGVLSVFNGFRSVIMDRLALLDPEVAITAAEGKTIADADSVVKLVSEVAGVEKALPVVEDNALAMFLDYQMPVRIKGVTDNYCEVTNVDSVIIAGEFKVRDEVSGYAVPGVVPAIQLQVRPGYLRMLRFYAPRRVGNVDLSNPIGAFTCDSLFVAGIFQLQQGKYDSDLVYVPIGFARDLLDYTTEATSIELRLAAGADEAMVLSALRIALGPAFTVKNRLMQQIEAYRLVNVEKWMAFLLLSFILLIATFNVISSLSLLVIEKDESMSILRALGASDGFITRIFVAEGWLITLVGTVLGIIGGLLLCLGQQHYGWLKLGGDPEAMIVNAYPVEIMWTDVLVVIVISAVVALITSVATSLTVRGRLRRT